MEEITEWSNKEVYLWKDDFFNTTHEDVYVHWRLQKYVDSSSYRTTIGWWVKQEVKQQKITKTGEIRVSWNLANWYSSWRINVYFDINWSQVYNFYTDTSWDFTSWDIYCESWDVLSISLSSNAGNTSYYAILTNFTILADTSNYTLGNFI
jgi:hypothetical protein